MQPKYDPSTVEPKWQKAWAKEGIHRADLAKAKRPYYALVMFPYPSGDKLHVGHWYNFAPADTAARYQRMKGFDVFEPMGFDAFGLPAENYAIKTGVPPAESITKNVQTMVAQLSRIGAMYDWDRMVNTSVPEYYRWTQWLFLQMFQHDLAEKKEGNVNWCPKDQTVLANEQVQDGACERCGTAVEQRSLSQWYWKITRYAEPLLEGLETLDWPEQTKLMQRHWIGKSVGAEVHFEIVDHDHAVVVFTTRPDTLYGATYLVLAPEHPLVGDITTKAQRREVEAYQAKVRQKSELQRTTEKVKTGVATGAMAVNPATGEKVPVWIADYVLPHYGTGAIMAVPAHDERDFEFAQAFDLPIKTVVRPHIGTYVVVEESLAEKDRTHLAEFGTVVVRKEDEEWGKFFAVTPHSEDAEKELVRFLEKHLLTESTDGGGWYADSLGTTNRVVYAGKTFHIVDDASCEAARKHGLSLGIPEEQVNFDPFQNGPFTGDGIAVHSDVVDGLHTSEAKQRMIAWLEDQECGRGVTSYRLRDWLVSRQRYWGAPIPIVYDPEGRPHPIPEEHLPWLLPTDVEFKPTGESPLRQSKEFLARTEKIFGKGWTPEYDTMDTFVCSSFYYLRYLMEGDADRFVDGALEKKWLPVSMYIGGPEHACMHLIYARFVMMALNDFGLVSHSEPFKKLVHQGLITNQGAKMSKSKGNVVSPDSFIERHGSDVFRMYLMFMGPFTEGGDWSDTGIKGIDRFVQRVWKMLTGDAVKAKHADGDAVRAALHRTIKAVTDGLENLRFNTAIAAMMELLNALEAETALSRETAKMFVLLLGPFAPHLADELWSVLGGKGFVVEQSWPAYDPALLKTETITIAVQVNGKLRGQVQVPTEATKDEVIAAAKAEPNVAKFLDGQTLKKEIFIAGRLVNFVV